MLRRPGVRLLAAALAVTAGTIVTPRAPAAGAATVPAPFTDSAVATFNSPTTVEWLPGNVLVVLEKGGQLLTGPAGGPFTSRLTLTVCTNSERGLLGIAPGPDFEANRFVYVYYTRRLGANESAGCVNRLSRFVLPASGPIDPASEHVVLDNISSRGGNHNGGAVELGRDGNLYVGIGDAGSDPRQRPGTNQASQDLSLLNGKVLRIRPDGTAPPGNPLLGEPGVTACATRGNTPTTPTTPCAEIYAWGLRNPWRLAFDVYTAPGTRFHINDVGQSTYEEVDLGAPANFGWPEREGPCPQGETQPCAGPSSGLVDPITAYPRSEGTVITGGAFVPPGVWPPAYESAYLFADAGSGEIWTLAADGAVDYDAPFATDAAGLRDMVFGYDTSGWATLYYVTGAQLRAIRPTGTTPPPAPAPVPFPDPAPIPPLEPGPGPSRMTYTSVPPYRAFDTADAPATYPGGRMAGGSTVLVDTNAPTGATAALINLTIADTAGPGFLRTWQPGTTKPATSTVNAETAGGYVANAAIVPIDTEGRVAIETLTDARVVVDVMGTFAPAAAATASGRFEALPAVRLADTRQPASTTNAYTDNGTTTVVDVARGGFPAGATGAYVLSIAAVAQPGGPGGYAGAYPGGGEYTGTSNVNVTPGDVRANMVVVPADASGRVRIEHLNTAGMVVDVLGYFTGSGAPAATSGQFAFVAPVRSIDTRVPAGFTTLGDGSSNSAAFTPTHPAAALVQNVTVTGTSRPGYLSTFPGTTPAPGVSTVNWTGAGQTRATLAITGLDPSDQVGYYALTSTDVVVDAIGLFTE